METKKMSRSSLQEGFSLIEIAVVIMIIGVLAGIVAPAAFRYLTSGRQNAAEAGLKTLSGAIDLYHGELGAYPKQLEDLVVRPSGPIGKKWTTSYLKKTTVPLDPWGRAFEYKLTPGSEHPYELYSWGPNGEDSPEEEHIDIWKI